MSLTDLDELEIYDGPDPFAPLEATGTEDAFATTDALPVVDPEVEVSELDEADEEWHPSARGAEQQRHLRAVPPRRRRQPRVGLWIGSVVTFASLFLLVAFNVFMVQGQFELDKIATQRTTEQKRYEKLREQVAELSAPESIVSKANSLGLQNPTGFMFLDAPRAGASKPQPDRTLTTQQQTYNDATKRSLGASP
jgi:hypothetical protein